MNEVEREAIIREAKENLSLYKELASEEIVVSEENFAEAIRLNQENISMSVEAYLYELIDDLDDSTSVLDAARGLIETLDIDVEITDVEDILNELGVYPSIELIVSRQSINIVATDENGEPLLFCDDWATSFAHHYKDPSESADFFATTNAMIDVLRVNSDDFVKHVAAAHDIDADVLRVYIPANNAVGGLSAQAFIDMLENANYGGQLEFAVSMDLDDFTGLHVMHERGISLSESAISLVDHKEGSGAIAFAVTPDNLVIKNFSLHVDGQYGYGWDDIAGLVATVWDSDAAYPLLGEEKVAQAFIDGFEAMETEYGVDDKTGEKGWLHRSRGMRILHDLIKSKDGFDKQKFLKNWSEEVAPGREGIIAAYPDLKKLRYVYHDILDSVKGYKSPSEMAIHTVVVNMDWQRAFDMLGSGDVSKDKILSHINRLDGCADWRISESVMDHVQKGLIFGVEEVIASDHDPEVVERVVQGAESLGSVLWDRDDEPGFSR